MSVDPRYLTVLGHVTDRRRRGLTPDEVLVGLRLLRPKLDPPPDEAELLTMFHEAMEITEPKSRGGDAAILAPDGSRGWPAPPAAAAFHGLAGRIVTSIESVTEADPVALLVTLLTIAGAIAGRRRVLWHAGEHAPNLYTALAGDTSAGRKGTAYATIRSVVNRSFDDWEHLLVPGLGSGEGLVRRLLPPGDETPAEPRAIVLETEMGRMLRVMAREGSTLSAMLRDGWDGTPMGRFLARGGDVVTNHHVAVLAHVTTHDLRDLLRDTDAANGFGNRFLWFAVRRTKLVAIPVDPAGVVPAELLAELNRTLHEAQVPASLELSPGAADDWEMRYAELALRPRYGLLGAITARAEAQVIRLALVYAVLDRATEVTIGHLEAAAALWDYAERSALYIFGNQTGNRWADLLRRALRERREVTATDARDLGIPSGERQAAIDLLVDLGLAVTATRPTAGRPARVIVATELT